MPHSPTEGRSSLVRDPSGETRSSTGVEPVPVWRFVIAAWPPGSQVNAWGSSDASNQLSRPNASLST